ncbi:MAG TPA: tetratricopeptide repeat protein [Terriglobales bacterium]|nr:tetratricopeptide repeat protein [Terriglobales bacterium]
MVSPHAHSTGIALEGKQAGAELFSSPKKRRAGLLCPRPHIEADGHYFALGSAVDGLLAPLKGCRPRLSLVNRAADRLGALFEQQQQLAEAISVCRRLLLVMPSAAAYFRMGVDLERLGDWQQAERTYQQALALAPELEDAKAHLKALQGKTDSK